MVRAAQRRADQAGGGNGPWIWPTTGTITGDYGCSSFAWYPPGYGCANFHDGIDIANGIGTPVRAPTSGVVAYVGWGEGSDPAFMVVLGHAGGLQSDYGHLLPRYVVAGWPVRAQGTSSSATWATRASAPGATRTSRSRAGTRLSTHGRSCERSDGADPRSWLGGKHDTPHDIERNSPHDHVTTRQAAGTHDPSRAPRARASRSSTAAHRDARWRSPMALLTGVALLVGLPSWSAPSSPSASPPRRSRSGSVRCRRVLHPR